MAGKQLGPAQVRLNKKTCKYQCGICLIEFPVNQSVHAHHSTVHLQQKWKCPLCGKLFTQTCGYGLHYKNFHMGMRFKCKEPDCDKIFRHKNGLLKHINAEHLKMRFKCQESNCGKFFVYKQSLVNHHNAAHYLKTRFKC